MFALMHPVTAGFSAGLGQPANCSNPGAGVAAWAAGAAIAVAASADKAQSSSSFRCFDFISFSHRLVAWSGKTPCLTYFLSKFGHVKPLGPTCLSAFAGPETEIAGCFFGFREGARLCEQGSRLLFGGSQAFFEGLEIGLGLRGFLLRLGKGAEFLDLLFHRGKPREDDHLFQRLLFVAVGVLVFLLELAEQLALTALRLRADL